MIFIYTTTNSRKSAEKLAENLIAAKLIACANIHPVSSMYYWRGRLVKEKEFAVLLKTRKQNFKKVSDTLKKIHPYDCPIIAKISVDANKDYRKWVYSETKA